MLRVQNVHKALEQGRETFSQLSCDKKRKVLLVVLGFYKGDTARVDLSFIGGSRNAGKISNNFIANHLKDIQFVDSSVTGMFERCETIGL